LSLESPSSGRPRVSEENVRRIRGSFERSPRKSTRRASGELGIPQPTLWRVLRRRLLFSWVHFLYHPVFVTLESLFAYCFNGDCEELTLSGRNENPVLRCECWLHWISEWVRNDVGYIVPGWSGLELLSYITMHLFISFGWKTHELYVWTLLCVTGGMSGFQVRGG